MKFLAHILVFSCFFPFLDVLRIGTDTQPNSMFIGTIILFVTTKWKLNTPILLLWLTFGISLLFVFNSNVDPYLTLKLVLNYLSPPIVATAAYIVFTRTDYRLSYPVFITYMVIYFIVAFVQTYIYNDFMTILLNEGRGILVGGRGVVALTTEPAFYGSTCLFFIIYSILNYSRKQTIFATILLLYQTIILAKSTVSIAILGLTILIFAVVQLLKLRLLYVSMLSMFMLILVLNSSRIIKTIETTRTGKVLTNFIKDPTLIAQIDASIAMRASNTFAPYFVIRHNNFLPMGYGRFLLLLRKLNSEGRYKAIITPETLDQRERIVGGLNMVLFQLGFLGLFFPLSIYLSFKRLLNRSAVMFAMILFVTTLFTQIQLMHSMIGLIIASAIFQSKILEQKNKETLEQSKYE